MNQKWVVTTKLSDNLMINNQSKKFTGQKHLEGTIFAENPWAKLIFI